MNKIIALFMFTLVSSVVVACPQPQPAAPQEPNDTEYCALGCAHLLKLKGRDGGIGCEEARVLELPDGDILTCEQFCIDTQNRGRSLCPSSWTKATQCEDVEDLRLQCSAETK